ncbi:hypothetical protein NDU88_004184 [Pleurodeles waltl]|uniref:Uncharacterized protein n=1 Tax=Pleurodeles waltl TaxID=8319 RepID=A0AAV7SI22_PLEWA|nr:hypothetical protein NDU88_004184 [Pleurodeles waltl]
MHLGAEQQPPTAPATEAARPAFPASRAVFRGCFSPASSGRHRLAAAAANRVPDVHLALVVSSRDASHPAPASTSVVCRTPLSSSLVSELKVRCSDREMALQLELAISVPVAYIIL